MKFEPGSLQGIDWSGQASRYALASEPQWFGPIRGTTGIYVVFGHSLGVTTARSNCFKTTMATPTEVNVDAAIASVISELGSIFSLKGANY